jgi:hypothetical protein
VNQSNLARRRLIVAIAGFAGATAIGIDSRLSLLGRAWAESAGQPDAGVRAAMLRMARLLYPHGELPDTVYAGILDRALSEVATGAEFGKQLDEAAAALDARAGRRWLDLEQAAQVAAMRDIETEAFFVAIQNAVRAGIYNDPAFWKHAGYAGPSKGFGGYLHRGAGEIDWLPEKAP